MPARGHILQKVVLVKEGEEGIFVYEISSQQFTEQLVIVVDVGPLRGLGRIKNNVNHLYGVVRGAIHGSIDGDKVSNRQCWLP